MGYKQMDNNFSFADLSLSRSMEHNRAINRMGKIDAIINWSPIESRMHPLLIFMITQNL
jgi:hypothetical protein